MPSQGWLVADIGSVERGHASPREVLSSTVREAGQTGAKPSMRSVQKVGSGTIGIEDAWVEG